MIGFNSLWVADTLFKSDTKNKQQIYGDLFIT